MSCSLLGDGVREVCSCGNGKCKDFAATPVVVCVQMGEASKTRNATTKARRSGIKKVSLLSGAGLLHTQPVFVISQRILGQCTSLLRPS